jgi:hypothetical protein
VGRWLLDPAQIDPGTAMPSGLFTRDANVSRWVLKGIPENLISGYDKDHVQLLVRYMFQLSPEEQRRLMAASPGAGGGGGGNVTTGRNRTRRGSGNAVAMVRGLIVSH